MIRADGHYLEWKSLVLNWLSVHGGENLVIAAEVRKLLKAAARVENDLPTQISTAEALATTPKVSPSEFLNASKESAQSRLMLGQEVNLSPIIEQAVTLYGEDWRGRIAHGLALACMMSRRHDLARALLQQTIATLEPVDAQWAKSLWALARMEFVLTNYAVSAQHYYLFANAADIPVRYRLQARLKWLSAIMASGEPAAIIPLRDDLIAATDQIEDFDLLLDFARQLRAAPPELYALASALLSRGRALALAQFENAKDPAVALGILFRLTRRQAYDFGRYQDALNIWNSLSQETRDWLWSPREEFWEYLSWIFIALTRLHLDQDAQSFANAYLDDPATPLEGRLRIMHSVATWKMHRRDISAGMQIFSAMTALVPIHWQCAEAYYWLAVQAKKNGQENQCVEYARKIQLSQGSRKGLLTDWKLDCRAALLRSGLVVGTPLQSANYLGRISATVSRRSSCRYEKIISDVAASASDVNLLAHARGRSASPYWANGCNALGNAKLSYDYPRRFQPGSGLDQPGDCGRFLR